MKPVFTILFIIFIHWLIHRLNKDGKNVNNNNIQYPWDKMVNITGINHEIAICAIIRNQHSELRQWLFHHYFHFGINKFYIYDHLSQPSLKSIIQDYIDAGIVIFTDVKHTDYWFDAQLDAYKDCFRRNLKRHDWVGVFDVDEYLWAEKKGYDNLLTYLNLYKHQGALAVNWILHSFNHLQKSYKNLDVRHQYKICSLEDWHDNRNFKSFVYLPAVKFDVFDNAHHFPLKSGFKTVDQHGRQIGVQDRWSTIDWQPNDHLYFHHFTILSYEHFNDKRVKGKFLGRGQDFIAKLIKYSNHHCNHFDNYI